MDHARGIDRGFLLLALVATLVGVPSALGLGIVAGQAAAPGPLVTPTPDAVATPAPTVRPDAPSAAMSADLEAIGATFTDGLAAVDDANYLSLPIVEVHGDDYVFLEPDYAAVPFEWASVPVSDGVEWGGQYGYDEATWCVWLEQDGFAWHVSPDGIDAGTCFPGG